MLGSTGQRTKSGVPDRRFTLDGGGGASAGGDYTLIGTIGRAKASPLSAGMFTLESGFWPGWSMPITGGAVLVIQLLGDSVLVSWSPAALGVTLEMTDALSIPAWKSAPGGNPATVEIIGTARYFRLRWL